ncbi:MAG: type 1 glutamine amidotransferase [Burkholderiales bacterium]
MKPIAVFQNSRNDGPGEFEAFATAHALPLAIHRLYAGDSLPPSMEFFSGLCILGSPKSANDERAEFRQMERLILEARDKRIPVIGHCFGGQILAKALGGSVGPAPVAEIGWSDVSVSSSPLAREWFGARRFPMFQWHYETFSVPPGATLLAASEHCAHQAFCADDIHLGMQFHCEVDEVKIEEWLDKTGRTEIASASSPGIQDPEKIRALVPTLLQTSKRTAAAIYTRWAAALTR